MACVFYMNMAQVSQNLNRHIFIRTHLKIYHVCLNKKRGGAIAMGAYNSYLSLINSILISNSASVRKIFFTMFFNLNVKDGGVLYCESNNILLNFFNTVFHNNSALRVSVNIDII